MTTTQRFDTKDPSESVVLSFDFTLGLVGVEALTGLPTVAVRVLTGTDSNPTAIFNGNAAIDSTAKLVLVPVQAGVDGVDYDIVVTISTTNTKKVLALGGILPVRAQ